MFFILGPILARTGLFGRFALWRLGERGEGRWLPFGLVIVSYESNATTRSQLAAGTAIRHGRC